MLPAIWQQISDSLLNTIPLRFCALRLPMSCADLVLHDKLFGNLFCRIYSVIEDCNHLSATEDLPIYWQ